MAHLRALDRILQRIYIVPRTDPKPPNGFLPRDAHREATKFFPVASSCGIAKRREASPCAGPLSEMDRDPQDKELPCRWCAIFQLAILRPSWPWMAMEQTNNRNLSLPNEEDEKEAGHSQACLTFNMNEVKVLKVALAKKREKNERDPWPILLSCLGRRYLMMSRLYWYNSSSMAGCQRHGPAWHGFSFSE